MIPTYNLDVKLLAIVLIFVGVATLFDVVKNHHNKREYGIDSQHGVDLIDGASNQDLNNYLNHFA